MSTNFAFEARRVVAQAVCRQRLRALLEREGYIWTDFVELVINDAWIDGASFATNEAIDVVTGAEAARESAGLDRLMEDINATERD